MHIQHFIKTSICSEDNEEKHIFTPIKGHNSVVYIQIQPICNPKPLLPDINVHAKFEENRSKATQVRVRKQQLLFINKFSPFAIPNPSSPLSMSMQFEENKSKTIQVRVWKRSADRRMDADRNSKFLEDIT